MFQRTFVCGAIVAAMLSADTVVLRNGRTISSEYLGGDSRRVRIAVGDRVDSLNIDEISEIKFGASTASAPVAPVTPPAKQRAEVFRPNPATPPARTAAARPASPEIPVGTTVVIRMIDDVDSERD